MKYTCVAVVVLGMLATTQLQANVIGLSYLNRTWDYHAYIHQSETSVPFVNLPGSITYRNWGTDDADIYPPLKPGEIRRPVHGTVTAFAADLDANPFYGLTSYSIYEVQNTQLEELWGRHYADLGSGTAQDQQNKATAFSLAVWEINNEQQPTLDVLQGSTLLATYSYKGQSGLANQWLSELDGSGPRLEIKRLVPQFPVGEWKDLYITTGIAVPVPEPSTLALLCTGLIFGGIFICRKYR